MMSFHLEADKAGQRVLLVVGSTVPNCARLPEVLARAGMAVSVLAHPKSLALASRHVQYRIAGSTDLNTTLMILRKMITDKPDFYDWIILGDEDILDAVAHCRTEPWAARCFPVPIDSTAVDIIAHKTSFIIACQEAEILVPVSKVCSGFKDAMLAANSIGFPLLVKADFGASGMTVILVRDEAEMYRTIPKMANAAFTVQQLIKGQAGVTEMLLDRGRPVAIVSSFMRGIEPMPFSPASSRCYRRIPAAEGIAFKLGELTGFHGFCGFDWILEDSAEQRIYTIEFHHRPTLGFHKAYLAGVDFSEAVQRMMDGHQAEPIRQTANQDTLVHFFPKDLKRAIRQWDLPGLARWIPGVAYTDFPWSDIWLLHAYIFTSKN